jgi:hypothetical protein
MQYDKHDLPSLPCFRHSSVSDIEHRERVCNRLNGTLALDRVVQPVDRIIVAGAQKQGALLKFKLQFKMQTFKTFGHRRPSSHYIDAIWHCSQDLE